MKVFTNTNYATGRAADDIKANRIVGLETTGGDVIQAIATTAPIGVSHNFDTDEGCPVTVIPIGGGFARVTAGESLGVADLGKSIGPDALGRAVLDEVNMVGILAGLSADVEGATAAVEGDDVVVLLSGVIAAAQAVPESKGTLEFVVVEGDVLLGGVKDIVIEVTVDGQTLSDKTDASGVVKFVLTADDYAWAATSVTHSYDTDTGTATVAAFSTTVVNIVATAL